MNKFEKDYRKELREQKKKSKKFAEKCSISDGDTSWTSKKNPSPTKSESTTFKNSSWTATPDLKQVVREANRRAWIRTIIGSILMGIGVGFIIVSLTN